MSRTAAVAFLERVEKDNEYAEEISALAGDPDAALARVRETGYDVTREEMQEALLGRYGVELTLEQLDQIAAGVDGSRGR